MESRATRLASVTGLQESNTKFYLARLASLFLSGVDLFGGIQGSPIGSGSITPRAILVRVLYTLGVVAA